MSSYFDRVEEGMCELVERRAHRPWYVRIRRVGRTRALVVVLAALVVAAPAVGAVTNWFGFGTPEYFPKVTAIGAVIPGTSELLPLRVADPQGGPAWGMRIVRTTQGDTCIQLGRVEAGQLGSLGIDYAWDNDHQFHPFPNASIGENCGTTDAAGHAFVNVTDIGVVASANPIVYRAPAVQAKSCHPVPMNDTRLQAPPAPKQYSGQLPLCPPGSERIVFMGLLGPDATSITYQTPDRSLRMIKTTGSYGAYLLVFPLDQATCNLYGNDGGVDDACGGTGFSSTTPRPGGAITTVTYRGGRVCNLDRDPRLAAEYRVMMVHLLQPVGDLAGGASRRRHTIIALMRERQAASKRFLRAHHLTQSELQRIVDPQCPVVGYVAPKQKPLTPAELATRITVSRITISTRPATLPGPSKLVSAIISFTAPQPVTDSDSWYEGSITPPTSCGNGTGFYGIGVGDVRAGQELQRRVDEPACKGVYHGVIGYMQNWGPQGDGEPPTPGIPGQDGSLVVGHFSFTVH